MFSPKQEKAIELLALGNMTYTDVADTVNVAYRTILRWRRDNDFAKEVQRRALEHLRDQVPSLYSVLKSKATSEEDLSAIRLIFERLDRVDEDVNQAQGTITFTWGNPYEGEE